MLKHPTPFKFLEYSFTFEYAMQAISADWKYQLIYSRQFSQMVAYVLSEMDL